MIDVNIKRNVDVVLSLLEPVAIAVDVSQTNDTKIADAVCIWKHLIYQINAAVEAAPLSVLEKKIISDLVRERYNKAMSPAHFAAFELSPSHQLYRNISSCVLDDHEIAQAEDYMNENFTLDFLAKYWRFKAKLPPFHLNNLQQAMYLTDYEWWVAFSKRNTDCISEKTLTRLIQLTTACATTAGLERLWSRYGLVHSKLRNRLGNEKAAKLVTLHQLLNK